MDDERNEQFKQRPTSKVMRGENADKRRTKKREQAANKARGKDGGSISSIGGSPSASECGSDFGSLADDMKNRAKYDEQMEIENAAHGPREEPDPDL